MDHIYNLSVKIGGRGTATEGEYKARDYIQESFDRLGIKNTTEPFKTITSFSYPYILIYLVSIIGAAFLLFHRPVVSIILTGSGAVTFFLENSSFEIASLMLPKGTSYNVIGHIPASGKAVRRVIVTAHYDSSRSSIMFSPRFVKGFRNTFIGVVISMFLMFILTALYWITHVVWLKVLVGVLTLDPLVTVVLLIHREIRGQYTHGANDNASGVAVLLGIAERFSASPLANTDIFLVATGAEEVGMAGMVSFVREHKDLVRDAYIINIDNCGAGKVSYIIEEGMIKQYAADHTMVAIADKVAKGSSMNVTPRIYTMMSTDALVPLSRGYRAMSIMAFDDEGMLPNWHWETDVFENVRPVPVNLAYEFATKMIASID